jgi:hypothetical protein
MERRDATLSVLNFEFELILLNIVRSIEPKIHAYSQA